MTRRSRMHRVVVDGTPVTVCGPTAPNDADVAVLAEFAQALRGGPAALAEYDRRVRAEAAAREAER